MCTVEFHFLRGLDLHFFYSDIQYFIFCQFFSRRYFTSKPARSCVAVRELPKGVLCEIEAIALK